VSDDPDNEAVPPHRRMRPLAWTGIAFAALLLLLVAGVVWVLNTQAGARVAANSAVALLGGRLEIGNVEGTIAGPLTVSGIRWHDESAGVDVHVARVSLDVALQELFARRAHILFVDTAGVDVRLFPHPPKPEQPSHFALRPPLDIVLDRFTLKDARVSRDSKTLVVLRTVEAIGSWTGKGLDIRKLNVDSPDGNVRLAASVSEQHARTQPVYFGQATGTFRWKLGELEYAGNLTANSTNEQLALNVHMSAPFPARLDATAAQTKALPWKFELAVPTFDPRENLLKGGALESLAATLHGEGDLTVAEVRGTATMNGQSLRIEPARVRYADEILKIEALTLIDPAGRGTLSATGDVRFGSAAAAADATAPPFYANLDMHWQEVVLPKEWVGQPLGSHGTVKVVGSMKTFTAGGRLALGPPDHLADIVIDVAGTPEQIQVKQLAVTEKTGNLNATGTVTLKPHIGWQFNATADRFDPGQFLVGWPGQLGFALDTSGRLLAGGPEASLDLKDLSGKLRGRALEGRAALTLNPQKIVAGTLSLRSGRSSIGLTGRGGEALDLDTQFDIASLEDWLPRSAGSVNGKFHITGKWPVLAVEGGAQARALAFAGYSAKTIDVSADVRNPKSPEGSLRITATDILAGGFAFSNTELTASGTEKDHSAQLTATGQPLTVQVRVHGARNGNGWSGTIDQVVLAAIGLEPFSLRQPTPVSWSPRGFDLSELCLAGENMSACVAANQNEAGELNGKYRLEHVPLGLFAALAAPAMPLRIEAVIDGDGNIRRTPEGQLFGDVHIASASGRITESGAPAQEDAADALLTYENLQLEATLAGTTANGTIGATLGNGGMLAGKVALADLGSASASINGSLKLVLADLSPAGLFVPQLANVQGRGEANGTVAGTLAAPRVTGDVALMGLAAEVPQLGIKLHDGELTANLTEDRNVTLNGSIGSGDGQITLTGDTTSEGVVRVKVQGKDFVAANIPGAKVFVAPDLVFARSNQTMTLGGSVTVPRADVDLTKLPKQGASVQRASPDVVVVDDKDSAVEKSKSVPLEAHVTVILGNNVSLVGYGLTSKVAGQLVVHEVPDQQTTATGELRVSGTYKAYGQDLTIQQGRLLYAGQSIADPQLNLVATRTVDTVTAKLIVTGSAQKPLLEVTSDPPMPQTQALSYLVAGKPLSEVGSGEGDMVQSAARSLGGAAGNLLAKGLGRRLGIDQIGIEDTPEAGGSAFTVGQYLSPRLYLSYGVGLFEPGQVVTLRYRINSRLSLEAVQGTLSQRAGINFRLER
jgi:translocation and assembly module TamB